MCILYCAVLSFMYLNNKKSENIFYKYAESGGYSRSKVKYESLGENVITYFCIFTAHHCIRRFSLIVT